MAAEEPKTQPPNRGLAPSTPVGKASAAPKRTLNECVSDILIFIADRFGNPTEFEALIAEFMTLIPAPTEK